MNLGIYFDEIHSFHDLDMYLSKVEISPAKPKTTYIDIPGADGSIDQTEVHGEVKFYDRDAKFTFTMNPAGDLSDEAWEEKKTEFSNAISGKRCKITLDKDSDYYYTGRCTVNEFLSDRRIRQIVVTAKLEPYKMKHHETVLIYELSETPKTIYIPNARKSVLPIIECTGDCKIGFGNYTIDLNAGVHQYVEINFVFGVNTLSISGTGTITFRFREGDL